MALPNSGNSVRRMSVEASDPSLMFSTARASKMAKSILEAEARPGRDPDEVASAIEQRFGIGFWQLVHLAKGRAKVCDIALFGRMRAAYLDICERQVGRLQHEIAIEKAIADDDLADLEARARALAEEIQARKAALSVLRRT